MPVWHHLIPEQVGKGRERKKINIVVPFGSYSTRNRKEENKNYRFVPFIPDA